MNTEFKDTTLDEAQENALIAEQNDAFRKRDAAGGSGKWVFTAAIDVEGSVFLAACMAAVEAYTDFNDENDPYGTHEMGFMEVLSKKVWWKIDLYNVDYTEGTPEPAVLAQTRRVLTILFPSDY